MDPRIYLANAYVCLAVGVPLNVLLLWLVSKRSPNSLRPYGVVLQQMCVIDLTVAVMTFLHVPVGERKEAAAFN